MLVPDKRHRGIYLLFGIIVLTNAAFWFYSNNIYVKWGNIPPAQTESGASIMFLGDKALAFRGSAFALQNYGSVGGDQSLNNYNYGTLGKWLHVLRKLDPRSNFVPYLAAYYYSAVPDATKLPPVVDYLEEVGMDPYPGRWRWLAQAAFLAKHRLKDNDEALRIARKLGSIYKSPMPVWTRNMESMFMADMGDRQAAYLLMLEVLKSDGEKMSNSEYNSNIRIICDIILKPAEALKNPLCQKNPAK